MSFRESIVRGIAALQDRRGSSATDIQKYIASQEDDSNIKPKNGTSFVQELKSLVESGDIVENTGRNPRHPKYQLSPKLLARTKKGEEAYKQVSRSYVSPIWFCFTSQFYVQ